MAAINVVTSKTSFTQSRSGSQTLRNEVALDQATIPALCSPARRRPRRYGTGEQADGKLPDYGPGRQTGICAAIWACGCTLRCSQGRWYLKGTAPLSEHQPGGFQPLVQPRLGTDHRRDERSVALSHTTGTPRSRDPNERRESQPP